VRWRPLRSPGRNRDDPVRHDEHDAAAGHDHDRDDAAGTDDHPAGADDHPANHPDHPGGTGRLHADLLRTASHHAPELHPADLVGVSDVYGSVLVRPVTAWRC
jgi:hypothetical protein